MIIKLNQIALTALLESPEGPVGQEIKQRAESVQAAAKGHVVTVMHRQPAFADAVRMTQRGDGSAVVGIENDGRVTSYLIQKEIREKRFLVRALGEVFPG